MLAANPISQTLMSKQLQMQAQSLLEQARLYKALQNFEMALVSYGQAKVIFKHVENVQKKAPPLSELKSAFSQAQSPQTPKDESLRQRIADVYFERAEVLKSLGEQEKAQKSYEKAQAWGYKVIPTASTADLIPSVNSTIGLSQSVEFFPSKSFLTPSPKLPEGCPQEKHRWVAQVFEAILKQFQDLDLCQSSPSLFLVYAHNNNRLGKADAEASQRVIQWLSNLRSNLYSDRSAGGHQALPFSVTLEDKAKANDILSSQLCLLPNHSGTVDHVVLCGSELLGRYMASPYYQGFYEAIQRAYQETAKRTDDFTQVEAAVRKVVDANLNEKEFHHVLTELAFLQIRYEYQKGEHWIIPLLLNSTAKQCLPKFILDSTTIRIEDSIWRTPNLWNKKQTYQDEGLHVGFFKLLKRLLVKQERYIALVEEKIYQACLQKLREDSTHALTAETFSLFLNQSCVMALDALKQEHGSDLREVNVQKAYESLRTEIKQINGESLVPLDQLRSALEEAYSAKRLAIQRLSGPPLPMEHCYINLAVVENEREKALEKEKQLREEEKRLQEEGSENAKEEKVNESKEKETEKSKEETTQNYFYRLPSAEAINSNSQKLVPLEKLFDPRELSKDKTVTPKRILIRGRAGVGKTTLSKKVVYEYTQKAQWRDRFEYVLWIPLRTLKGKSNCDLVTLFHELYFQNLPKGQSLAKTLAAQINGPAKDKTLFVLDGWDEIAQEWGEHEPMSGFLKQLLNQPAVLITSRPYVDLKQADPMDLELETLGFSRNNVTAYLDNPGIVSTSDAKEIKHFIQSNAFIHELINVPIQLDALCYSWDEIKRMQKGALDAMTVSALYQAMMNKLWRKDMLLLGKRKGGELLTASYVSTLESSSRIEKLVKVEQNFLSALAFRGLQRNQIEFGHCDLHTLIDQFEEKGVDLPVTLEANLKKLSFLHADEAEESYRSYHFMHLTFQEFFAAKFLVQHLQAHVNTILKSNRAQTADIGIQPSLEELESFIATHKYNPRYEIVWWMVAGLLEGQALERFFMLLQEAPRDLIGLRHQQVMMGCLNEARVQLSPATINKLERELMQWLDFEEKKEGNSSRHLGRQRVFPEHLLVQRLSQPKVEKEGVIKTLAARPALSTEAILILVSALKDEDSKVRSAAAGALSNQRELSADVNLALVSALKDEDRYVRSAAAGALGKQRELSADVILVLASALKDADSNVRSAAADVLGNQRKLSSDVILSLASALKDEDNNVSLAAEDALGKQRELSSDVILSLASALKDEDWEVRSAVEDTLGNQRELSADAVLVLVPALKDADKYIRSAAAVALGNQRELSADVISSLASALKDADMGVRSAAAGTLGNQRKLSADAILSLVSALKDEDLGVRLAAEDALDKQRKLSADVILSLISTLKDTDKDVRYAAARALGNQRELSADVILSLASALKDMDKYVQSAAKDALSTQRELSADVILSLLLALKDTDRDVRSAAAGALGNQRELSADAILSLASVLKDADSKVRSAAADALGNQCELSSDVILSLASILKDANSNVRSAAACALGKQHDLSADVILSLASVLKDVDSNVRSAAAGAVGNQHDLSADVILSLASVLKDADSNVRSAAAGALGNQHNLSADVILSLISTLKDADKDVRYAAARALGKQRELSADVILSLVLALKDAYWGVRSAAADALGNQRELSSDVILSLVSALKDADSYVRASAARVLGKQRKLSANVILSLVSALKDAYCGVKSAATDALNTQRELSVDAILPLVSALKDADRNVRSAAAGVLGNQRELSADVNFALVSALKDEDRYVRSAAAVALGNQRELSADMILVLLSTLKNADRNVGSAAADVLGKQRELSTDVILSLVSALKDADRNVRSAATGVLGNQRELSADVILSLLSALKNKDRDARSSAVRVLVNQRKLSADMILSLASALKDVDLDVRSSAVRVLINNQRELSVDVILSLAWTLKNVDWEARSAVRDALGKQRERSTDEILVLVAALKDKDSDVRSVAADVLGKQRKLSANAILSLASALKDKDRDVRSSAADALGNQRELSTDAILSLSSALKDAAWNVRLSAARALGKRRELSTDVILSLVSALKDSNNFVRSGAMDALVPNINRLLPLLPNIKQNQIKALYINILLPQRVEQISPLYIQDNQLYFYTTMGSGQSIKLSTSESKKITEAFRAAQVNGGITSGLKKQWLW